MSNIKPEDVRILTTDIPQGYSGKVKRSHHVSKACINSNGDLAKVLEKCEEEIRKSIADRGYNAIIGTTYSHSPIFQQNGMQLEPVGYSVLICGHVALFNPPL